MPPKKNAASKKTLEKQKQKVVEDKTFGLKNKKGAKQQKFIQQVQKQVTHGNKSAKELERIDKEKSSKKDEKKREIAELNELFKPVAELQKCAKGVDPKSVLCAFYKQGTCLKGEKCKFSHDLAVERKAEKRGIYAEVETNHEGMHDWDLDKLEKVINTKHEATNKGLPPTTIICKYFIDAVENYKYGWFWECPNGKSCHYIHALPPDFVLKRDQKKMEEQKEVISLEDLIERERQNLCVNQTKVTLQSFMAWKKRKKMEKLEKCRSDKAVREANYKQGRVTGISGREIFEFDPTLIMETMEDDDGSATFVVDSKLHDNNEDDYTGPMREINLDTFNIDNIDNGTAEIDTNNVECETKRNDMGNFTKSGDVVVDEELFGLEEIEEEIDGLELEE